MGQKPKNWQGMNEAECREIMREAAAKQLDQIAKLAAHAGPKALRSKAEIMRGHDIGLIGLRSGKMSIKEAQRQPHIYMMVARNVHRDPAIFGEAITSVIQSVQRVFVDDAIRKKLKDICKVLRTPDNEFTQSDIVGIDALVSALREAGMMAEKRARELERSGYFVGDPFG